MCFLENTLYLCPDTEPQVTSREKKMTVAQLVVKLIWRPTKARRHILIVPRSSPQTITFQIFLFFSSVDNNCGQ